MIVFNKMYKTKIDACRRCNKVRSKSKYLKNYQCKRCRGNINLHKDILIKTAILKRLQLLNNMIIN